MTVGDPFGGESKGAAIRRGGAGESIRFTCTPTSLGDLLVAATTRGVCHVALGDAPGALTAELRARSPAADLAPADAEPAGDFGEWVAAVAALAERPGTFMRLPLDLRGTAFQSRVWERLRAIPAGETASYSGLARELGLPGGARAVAGACAANPVALVIPCHRVVRGDGTLSGYRWGVGRKAELLRREAPLTRPGTCL